ncbi:PQQ-dependent sugar dehydrogenase [Adhaeribacter radiodurans]|uniref:PQQ-dependent sugar dehydrogenase n=1 Tax=Adhaeribacter radiodurans TaxID=2745197 RepID=A0A7L7L9W8_9BACT|nr:PQQ-dependent sugar dehydrogenase [Adhaeribacter radiodurans]QMU29620.1 PQQ-dependent sugar dehydrogenase [Adhaeribacter radiodurans]
MKKINKLLLVSFLLTFGVLAILQARQNKKGSNLALENLKHYAPATPKDKAAAGVQLKVAFPNLTFNMPVEFVSPNDGTNRNFVIAQEGVIHVFPNNPGVKTTQKFLDITSKVVSGGERGLLGIAFHPDFKTNGYFYVNYTRGKDLETAISRFQVSKTNPNQADPKSEVVLLTYDQPFSNHNGGKVAFGKDGYLYIAAGDGGSGGDPHNNGQNKTSLLGKILRIDVNKSSGNLKYSIPADNPFKGNKEGYREEIYAYGLRNPWRFSFDKTTGDLWVGDVGQNKIEEVDIVKNGQNYGWRVMEADECFNPEDCNKKGYALPVHSYQQSMETGKSITGGHVYRGKKLAALRGKYVYGDYVTGNIWTLTPQGNGKYANASLMKLDGTISSFGEDANNELYLCSYNDGKIYTFAASGAEAAK